MGMSSYKIAIASYQAILFDFDMTLAYSVGVIAELLHQAAEHFGYSPRSLTGLLNIVGKDYTHFALPLMERLRNVFCP